MSPPTRVAVLSAVRTPIGRFLGSFATVSAAELGAVAVRAALAQSGVAIHEFQPAMVHAKTLTVDGALLLVGSINFDPRSFSLNAECGIVVASARLAAELDAASDADLARSRQITAAEVAERPLGTRAIDAICYWFRAEL